MSRILPEAHALEAQMVDWRRHLHAHPELSFEEVETSAFVARHLQALPGIEVSRPSGNCVVGRLAGSAPGPVVAIRADMDALPVTEQTNLPFSSRKPGIMHACGHDGHTAILMGVAQMLSARRDAIRGEIRFLFQEGEETPPGGARGLIAAGALKGVDRVIGLHLWSGYELGTICVNPGRLMAACDVFRIEVRGRGGHIGVPQDTVDPIAIGGQIVGNLQHLVAREVDPLEPAVVGVTGFQSGISVGVVPDTAVLTGGTNMFAPEVRDLLERRIGEIAHGICSAHGATCDYDYTRVYDAVINDPETAGVVDDVARRTFPDLQTVSLPPIMPGEDFSFYGHEAPSCYVPLGAGNPDTGKTYSHHDPRFDFDEDALKIGATLLTEAALRLLETRRGPAR